MSRTFFHDFYREDADGNETQVTVEYSATPYVPAQTYGPAENCYPAEGGEIEINRVHTDADGWGARWSDDEDEKWRTWLAENPDMAAHGDY